MADYSRALEVLKYLKDGGYSLQDLIHAIEAVSSETGGSKIEKNAKDTPLTIRIANILHELGVRSNLSGYAQITDALTAIYNDASMQKQLTTVLYPQIAKKYNTTTSGIERCIRQAIRPALASMPMDVKKRYFPRMVACGLERITTSEFLSTLVERLHLEEVQ